MITMPSSDPALSALALPGAAQEQVDNSLGQEDFLQLMIEQFRNQDPFQPMENGEFIGQLAQFSTVSGIGEMSESVENLASSLYASQAMQAAGIVGRTVLAEGSLATLEADGTLAGGVDLPYASSAAVARIFDEAGQLVKEIPLGSRAAGMASFEWDGRLADGSTAEPGRYRVAGAIRNGESESELAAYVGTRVESVALSPDGRGAQISTANGERISFSQIRAIM